MRPSLSLLVVGILLLGLGPLGCSDSTTPPTPQGNEALFEGQIDPEGGSFLLARIEQPGVVPLYLDLVGSNFTTDPENSRVLIDVAVVNRGSEALYPNAILWISGIRPAWISVANADILPPTMGASSPIPFIFGFDYSASLGEDGVLEPGEQSEAKTWIFYDPEMVSFSFVTRAEFSLQPAAAVITGVVFQDSNQNGVHERGEGPFHGAQVRATFPDGSTQVAQPNADGAYRFQVVATGLYELRLELLVDCVSCITTPNPRQVLIVPDTEGDPQSVYGVDFGAVCAPCGQVLQPVRLSEDSPDSLMPQGDYTLIEGRVEGTRLHLRVGFSGCGPDHHFELVAGRDFMESMPVATWLRLLHDDRGELCEAYFERELVFELTPIQLAHIADYGGPGVVRLLLHTPQGMLYEYRLEP